MKKIRILSLLLVVALLFAFAACNNTDNHAPEITGVRDFDCIVNTPIDLLEKVAALDVEDGDITPNVQITIQPTVAVNDGVAVFTSEGEYKVTYSVEDSSGKSAEEIAFVTAFERDVYVALLDSNGFEVSVSGSASLDASGVTDGAYCFVVNGAANEADVILSRVFSLKVATEYTVTYSVKSNVAGEITVKVGETEVRKLNVTDKDNKLTFTYTTSAAEGDEESVDVQFDLYLGSLGEAIEWTLAKVDMEYEQQGEGYEELLEGFRFSRDNIEDRFDGGQGVEGSSQILENGKSVSFEITKAATASWPGGIFIKTGLSLQSGSYKISFDVESRDKTPYEVCIQNGQWGDNFVTDVITVTTDRHVEKEITLRSNCDLWVYVRSGNYTNKITLSNLSVQAEMSGVKVETYSFGSFTVSHGEGGAGSVKVQNGKVIYTVDSFGSTDWHNKLESSPFRMEATGLDYVITFKAKASKPVRVVFAIPVYGGWDPTFLWQQFTIGTEETVFTFISNPADAARNYQFVWQFGSPLNQKYTNVTIEISDIQVCQKSALDLNR